jgi:hypothetical protein
LGSFFGAGHTIVPLIPTGANSDSFGIPLRTEQ